MKSYVYLLCHRNGRRFKIGKADHIIRRARSFGLGEIDWLRSIGLEMSSACDAKRLERLLLRTFDAWRLPAEEVLADAGVQDGATEWMHTDHLSRVDLFLQHVGDILPHARVAGAELSAQVQSLLEPAQRSLAEKEQRRIEAQILRATRADRRNAAALAAKAELEVAIQRAKCVLREELLRHLDAGTIVGMAAEGHGWNLILMDQTGDEWIWGVPLEATRFVWPEGSGGLVSSISEYRYGDTRVSSVRFGASLYDGWPASDLVDHVLADVRRLLRSLSVVSLGKFRMTLESCAWFGEWSQEAHDGLGEFVELHLPALQSRRAARMSLALFS